MLAAGRGRRLATGPDAPPKVLVECLGLPLLEWVRRAVAPLGARATAVVVGHGAAEVRAWLKTGWKGARAVVQEPQAGTGHAVRVALEALPGWRGDVLVVSGDVPQVTAGDLEALLDAHRRTGGPAALVTGRAVDPGRLGRVLRDPAGRFLGVVEARDAGPDALAREEFNAGLYAFDLAALRLGVANLGRDNAQGEEYLTAALGRLAAVGAVATVPAADPHALLGVNDAADLARAAALLRRRVASGHLAAGVRVVDPETTVIEPDVEIAAGARILPFTYVARGCRIGPRCVVGPFAHLRGGTVLEEGAQIGNFVEAKAAVLAPGAKAKHLTYLGDAVIGARANIGAGTITANYDGRAKHETRIGDGAFVGSGTVLVAPSEMGPQSMTGAGAVVTRNTRIEAGEVYVGVPARALPGRKRRGDEAAKGGS